MFLLFVLALIGVGYLLVTRYNALQRLAQSVREGHSNVMASMKKRVDLANKLVDIVRGYADHEKLTHISTAGAGDVALLGADQNVGGVLAQVIRVAGQHPDLKANQSYQQLMEQLDQLEGNLQRKREEYNARVREYNTSLTQLPTNLFASQLGFKPAPYFDVENADSLENLKEFDTDDGALVREMLSRGGRRVAVGSLQVSRLLVEKGREMQARHTMTRDERAGDEHEGEGVIPMDTHPEDTRP